MTAKTRQLLKDLLVIVTMSAAVATGIGAAAVNALDLETKKDHTRDIEELRGLIEDTRQWTWCNLNKIDPVRCSEIRPPERAR